MPSIISQLSKFVIFFYVVLLGGVSGWVFFLYKFFYTTSNTSTSSSVATATTLRISSKIPNFYSTFTLWFTTKSFSKTVVTSPLPVNIYSLMLHSCKRNFITDGTRKENNRDDERI